jgi:glycosyltransferase involved in cell wall biosynthesis
VRVAIIATYFAPRLGGGVARYEREVIPRLLPLLVAAGCQVTVVTLRDGEGLTQTAGVDLIGLAVGRDQPYKRILYNQIYSSIQSWGADVLLSLEGWLPVLPVWSKKSIVVIHDAHAELEWVRRDRGLSVKRLPRLLYWHAVGWRAARASDRIITDSRFAAEEISQAFGIPRPKIAPIYCGVDSDRLRPIHDPGMLARARTRYSLPEQFYLFVGPPTGDKNLRFVLQTLLGLEEGDVRGLPVVVTAGRPCSPPEANILDCLEESGRGSLFHFVGPIEEQDLPAVYSAARALIFPSLHEGFGLPPLEAMACGVPVVAANRTAVPEVVGDAAMMIDPASPQSLLDALERVNMESVRRDLIIKGFERAKMFSWDRTAQRIVAEVLP